MKASGQIQVPDALNRERYGGVGGWMDSRADAYVLEKRKNVFLLPQIEPQFLDLSTRRLVTALAELSRLHQVSRVPLTLNLLAPTTVGARINP